MAIFRKKFNFKIALCSGSSCFMALGLALPAAVQAVEFNTELLNNTNGSPVELKYFEQGNSVAPGSYNVDVYLNQTMIRRQDINFSANAETGEVRPVIQVGLLRDLGVDVARLMRDNLIPSNLENNTPLDIAALIPGASVDFEVNQLALLVSIPQMYVQRHVRGYVDPSLWDDGVTALFTNYQANFSRNTSHGDSSDYRYLGLRNGFNLFGWRLRNDSSLVGGTGMRNKFSSNRTYVERDIRPLKGTLSLGELYTNSEIFDSVRMRGVRLQSDIGMQPDNEVGYAPVVRGIAETNATVEIRQDGYVIYSTSVSPGAFEITDIYPSGSNGDLEVKIIEEDGRERTFKQSYSYLPVMTRKGNLRYSVSAGEYRNDGQPSPKLVQGTTVYGMSDNVTGYGGLLVADNYNATNLGLGLNTPYGGLSMDITHSQSKARRSGRNQGQSLRFLYSKTINSTDTNFTMVGYRYSTEGYRTLSQHVEDLSSEDFLNGVSYGRQKSRLDLTVNQTLFRTSSIYLSAGETTYWNRQGSTRRWQFGYSSSYRSATYSLAVSRTQDTGPVGQADTQFTASVSIPLGSSSRSHRAYASAVSSRHGDSSLQSGVSGYLDDQNSVNYSVQAGHSKYNGDSGSVGLGWDTAKASLSANYSQGRDNKHIDMGASGSVVVHGGGVTFGQSVGETFALVEVPDVSGVGIEGYRGVRTDGSGYAVVPYAQPYRYNYVNLDATTLGSDTEVSDNSKMVVPTRGAVVRSSFAAESGRRVQFELTMGSGEKIPFGAQAYDAEEKVVGMVDNLSRLLVFGIQDQGRLSIRWSSGSCSANYQLPPKNKDLAYERVELPCIASTGKN
ncbi:fimbria/pilus outer membrane usher protein [Pseudomonas paraeruginosa]|uniref:fimbria/pilus outer membrane usher protein n=1 Tax=Pseudomonas aeruginosa group TaxID=136841 RepID=UPI00053DD1F9|nr:MULTISPECIES: fimbria/pilus outer membrane usher protein [Pseudomonas aeruginosa group]KAB0743331.1 fimbrial biogenesis outer membrane usher protein [Pseudomonas aeruginosa]MBG4066331.1 fimbrial biogenesis outer membrane usher protein [Pseudomonas aeruginosa]MBG5599744.1 fimbrial biogenesis outer membrane usher protein [Pseudomonas aeruginosa]MBH3670983.1 fimbrial biogenesis outer membrane usher protein [Pseudomonas aeruginosa]MBH9434394.1 fimbrial biogenesis outer membrane usher protein [P